MSVCYVYLNRSDDDRMQLRPSIIPIMNFNPILLDVAERIETDRLVLRAVMPGDGRVHFPALQESLLDLRRHLGHLAWVIEEASLPNSENYCRNMRSGFIKRENLVYFIYSKSDRSMVGSVGLHRIEWAVPRFEVGYWCRTSAQRQGYVVEAVNSITAFAFAQLAAKRVEIRADDTNIPSWKVAEKAGFALEGILRNWDRDTVSNGLRDLRVYAKTA